MLINLLICVHISVTPKFLSLSSKLARTVSFNTLSAAQTRPILMPDCMVMRILWDCELFVDQFLKDFREASEDR